MADLPGQAISDYYFNKIKAKLFVHDEFGPKVEMPVEMYFRSFHKMPELEQKALDLCHGKVLDIGAGAGSHALELQKRNLEVAALEISPNACEVMAARGVKSVICEDIFSYSGGTYDTLLLLMNGIGLCGNLRRLHEFLNLAEKLLNPGGSLIFDSCDIAYMYEGEGFPTNYYGEIKCRYEYRNVATDWFQWLYIDAETMVQTASKFGWTAEIIAEDDHHQYLTVLTKN